MTRVMNTSIYVDSDIMEERCIMVEKALRDAGYRTMDVVIKGTMMCPWISITDVYSGHHKDFTLRPLHVQMGGGKIKTSEIIDCCYYVKEMRYEEV